MVKFTSSPTDSPLSNPNSQFENDDLKSNEFVEIDSKMNQVKDENLDELLEYFKQIFFVSDTCLKEKYKFEEKSKKMIPLLPVVSVCIVLKNIILLYKY